MNFQSTYEKKLSNDEIKAGVMVIAVLKCYVHFFSVYIFIYQQVHGFSGTCL
jgi:hypothetical protein